MRRRFPGRRGRGPRPTYRWSGNFTAGEILQAAGGNTTMNLINDADYAQATTIEADGPTLVRIVGDISMRSTVVGAIATWGIYVLSKDVTVIPTPTTLAGFIHGDLIQRGRTVLDAVNAVNIKINTKVKRKLREKDVWFVLNAAAQAVTFQADLRCLLKGGF